MERNINVAGDFIANQHIDIQILHADNVYTGASRPPQPLVVAHADEAEEITPVPERPVVKRYPKPSPHFLESPTFTYRYNAHPEAQRRLCLLYRFLIKEYREARTWIDPDTPPEDFCALFSGERNNKVIVWTETKQHLYGLLKRMKDRQLISIPKGYGIWKITENHFSDRRGKLFFDFNKEHMPQASLSAIDTLLDIIDPIRTTNADLDALAKKIGTSFGNTY